MWLALAAGVMVFVSINPYALTKLEETLAWLSLINIKYAMGRKIINVYAISYLYHIAIGSVAFGFMMIGLGLGAIKKWRETLFLLGFVGPFGYMTLYYSNGGFYVRNFVTAMPLLMIWAGVGFVFLLNLMRPRLLKIGFLITGLVVVLWPSVRNSVVNSYYYTKPWSYETILVDAEEMLVEGDIVVAHPFDPLPGYVTRLPFVAEERYSLAEFREEGANYALINMDWAANNFYGWMNTTFRESLKYWEKPYGVMRNTYWGISIEEMMSCVVADAYKPWQAPEAALFLVKVPDYSELDFEKIEVTDLVNFSVEEDYVYKIVARILSDQPVEKNMRSAYVRVDLYKNKTQAEGNVLGEQVSVSPRYWGEGGRDEEIYVHVGKGIGYAKLQFDYSRLVDAKHQIGKVVVYRSTEEFSRDEQCGAVNYVEYKDLLYPYSHGNL